MDSAWGFVVGRSSAKRRSRSAPRSDGPTPQPYDPTKSREDSSSSSKVLVQASKSDVHRRLVLQRNILALTLCLVLLVFWYVDGSSSSVGSSRLGVLRSGGPSPSSACRLSLGTYRGPQYDSPESGSVGHPNCLVESKWLKVSQHSVRFPGSDTTFEDWMWIDYHDRINVLVKAPTATTKTKEEPRFLVFEQTKYALEGKTSKAIIGGIMEPGETAEAAARREVEEEMKGLKCTTFHFLGRYRTDVNRGMGWVNAFLATDCYQERRQPSIHEPEGDQAEEVGAADTERQDVRSITLTELKEFVRKGAFMEVQWTATVALALLHPELSS